MQMTAFDWLQELNLACYGFFSTEKPGQRASNSELRRWFDKGSIHINGGRCKPFDVIPTVTEIVLFPKSEKRKTTFRF